MPRKQQFILSLIRAMLHSLGIRQTVDGESGTCCLVAQRYGKCDNAAFVDTKLIKMDSMTCCVRTKAVRVASNSCLMSDSLQYFSLFIYFYISKLTSHRGGERWGYCETLHHVYLSREKHNMCLQGKHNECHHMSLSRLLLTSSSPLWFLPDLQKMDVNFKGWGRWCGVQNQIFTLIIIRFSALVT